MILSVVINVEILDFVETSVIVTQEHLVGSDSKSRDGMGRSYWSPFFRLFVLPLLLRCIEFDVGCLQHILVHEVVTMLHKPAEILQLFLRINLIWTFLSAITAIKEDCCILDIDPCRLRNAILQFPLAGAEERSTEVQRVHEGLTFQFCLVLAPAGKAVDKLSISLRRRYAVGIEPTERERGEVMIGLIVVAIHESTCIVTNILRIRINNLACGETVADDRIALADHSGEAVVCHKLRYSILIQITTRIRNGTGRVARLYQSHICLAESGTAIIHCAAVDGHIAGSRTFANDAVVAVDEAGTIVSPDFAIVLLSSQAGYINR